MLHKQEKHVHVNWQMTKHYYFIIPILFQDDNVELQNPTV